MIVRKNMGRAKSLFVLPMVLLFSFATYNLVAMIMDHRADELESLNRKVTRSEDSNSKFHVAVTATDAAYNQWQCRIMYYWYKKMKDMPGSEMGKFTRILHSGRQDQLMEEIPTFVVDPLPEGLDRVRFFLFASCSICIVLSLLNCLLFVNSWSISKFTNPDIQHKLTFTTEEGDVGGK